MTHHKVESFTKLLLGTVLAADFFKCQTGRRHLLPLAFLGSRGDDSAAHFNGCQQGADHHEADEQRDDIKTDKS
ncbi:hypothetical protein D1872_261130 [compost metagenome]